MKIDHIFILCEDEGKAADDLVKFGLTEGSSRRHIGQGTTNRKFHFRNFFLEILWVHDEEEIKNFLTKPMGLWKRADFSDKETSRFGLCLTNTEDTDPLFQKAYRYQPDYFPEGFPVEIIKNEDQPALPWTFRLPMQMQSSPGSEPTDHDNYIRSLTKATFEYAGPVKDDFISLFESQDQIAFKKSKKNWLTLQFDEGKQGKSKKFKELMLTIEY